MQRPPLTCYVGAAYMACVWTCGRMGVATCIGGGAHPALRCALRGQGGGRHGPGHQERMYVLAREPRQPDRQVLERLRLARCGVV